MGHCPCGRHRALLTQRIGEWGFGIVVVIFLAILAITGIWMIATGCGNIISSVIACAHSASSRSSGRSPQRCS